MSNMPESIKEVFDQLREEILWLHTRWEIYRQLFAHSDKRVLFLDNCSYVFVIIHRLIVDSVHLSLSKLTDPSRTGKYENLSLEQLQERLDALGEENPCENLRKVLREIHKKCEVSRCRRNKRVAHSDLDTSLRRNLTPLPAVSQQMVEDTLQLLRQYMNAVERHYCKREVDYDHGIDLKRDADSVVAMLKQSFRFRELVKDGKIPDDEICKGDWSDA